jgi:hypothetical protein
MRGHGKLQRAEANRIAQAREAGCVEDEGHPIAGVMDARCPPHRQCQIVGSENGRQLNQLEVCIACRDRRWPSTQ